MMTEWIQRPFVALALLAVGMAFIPLNDAFIKLMSGHLSLAQISVIRGIMSLAILAFVSTGFRSMFALSGAEFVQFFARGMCLVVAMVLFFAALGSLPLPTCVAIFFVAPLLITLFSVPFLGERIVIPDNTGRFHRLGIFIAFNRAGLTPNQIDQMRPGLVLVLCSIMASLAFLEDFLASCRIPCMGSCRYQAGRYQKTGTQKYG